MKYRKTPDLRRKPPSRDPKVKFILYCEGKNTEPSYFKELEKYYDSPIIAIESIGPAGDPLNIVTSAAAHKEKLSKLRNVNRKRDSFEVNDQVWALFDRDEHAHYGEALMCGNQKKILMANSDPCFELWLILHHEDFDRPDDRRAVQAKLCLLDPSYDARGKKIANCKNIINDVDVAERRSIVQMERRKAEGGEGKPPYTAVGLLARAIRLAAEGK